MSLVRGFTMVILVLLLATVYSKVEAETVACSATTEATFVPSWGKVLVGQNSTARYIYQWMYWHKANRLQWPWSNSDSTYEPDAFFYNYEGKAYGLVPSGYWASDLPYAYVDTQLFDSDNEKAVTVGSAYAQLLNTSHVYYTFTYMTSGAGSSSWIKLSSQRGRRVSSYCYSTNCSFGCSTTSNIWTIPFSDHYLAPGCYQYWYQWDATSQSPC